MPNRVITVDHEHPIRLVENEAGERFWERIYEELQAGRHSVDAAVYGPGEFRIANLVPQAVPNYAQFAPEFRELPIRAEVPEEDKQLKLANEFMIGCDPEFVVLGSDGTHKNVNGLIGKRGEIGWDHDGNVVELRPKPAKSAFTLLKHLRGILREANSLHPFKHRAGAYLEFPQKKISLGGHIHFDLPFTGNDLESRRRLLALDELTMSLESLDILTKNECLKRRDYGRLKGVFGGPLNYGMFGDVRSDNGRMEYRTMASWLYSPITSFLCLTAAKLTAAFPKESIAIDLSNGVAKFFETFKEKDIDAKRVVEKILEPGLKLQRDPTLDFKTVWKTEFNQLGG